MLKHYFWWCSWVSMQCWGEVSIYSWQHVRQVPYGFAISLTLRLFIFVRRRIIAGSWCNLSSDATSLLANPPAGTPVWDTCLSNSSLAPYPAHLPCYCSLCSRNREAIAMKFKESEVSRRKPPRREPAAKMVLNESEGSGNHFTGYRCSQQNPGLSHSAAGQQEMPSLGQFLPFHLGSHKEWYLSCE